MRSGRSRLPLVVRATLLLLFALGRPAPAPAQATDTVATVGAADPTPAGRVVPRPPALQPVLLRSVQVTAPAWPLRDSGFFARRKAGLGTFFVRAEIERMRARSLSDVLRRVAGVSHASTASGRTRATMRSSGQPCAVQHFIDGVMTSPMEADAIPARDVEGVEIYRGAATVPPAFNRGTALCGVIVVWTRTR